MASQKKERLCPCYASTGFQKVVDLNESGFMLYSRTSHLLNVSKKIENTIIFQNTNDTDLITSNIMTALEKYSISCPRCRNILEKAKNVLVKMPKIEKNTLKGICNHCLKKIVYPPSPCETCEDAVKRFTRKKKEPKIKLYTRHVETWLPKVLRLLKDVLSKNKQTRGSIHSQLLLNNIHTNTPAGSLIDEPKIRDFMYSEAATPVSSRASPMSDRSYHSYPGYSKVKKMVDELQPKKLIPKKHTQFQSLGKFEYDSNESWPYPGSMKSSRSDLNLKEILNKQNNENIISQENEFAYYQNQANCDQTRTDGYNKAGLLKIPPRKIIDKIDDEKILTDTINYCDRDKLTEKHVTSTPDINLKREHYNKRRYNIEKDGRKFNDSQSQKSISYVCKQIKPEENKKRETIKTSYLKQKRTDEYDNQITNYDKDKDRQTNKAKLYKNIQAIKVKSSHDNGKLPIPLRKSVTDSSLTKKTSLKDKRKYGSNDAIFDLSGAIDYPFKGDFRYYFPNEVSDEKLTKKVFVSSTELIKETQDILNERAEKEKLKYEETMRKKQEDKERKKFLREEKMKQTKEIEGIISAKDANEKTGNVESDTFSSSTVKKKVKNLIDLEGKEICDSVISTNETTKRAKPDTKAAKKVDLDKLSLKKIVTKDLSLTKSNLKSSKVNKVETKLTQKPDSKQSKISGYEKIEVLKVPKDDTKKLAKDISGLDKKESKSTQKLDQAKSDKIDTLKVAKDDDTSKPDKKLLKANKDEIRTDQAEVKNKNNVDSKSTKDGKEELSIPDSKLKAENTKRDNTQADQEFKKLQAERAKEKEEALKLKKQREEEEKRLREAAERKQAESEKNRAKSIKIQTKRVIPKIETDSLDISYDFKVINSNKKSGTYDMIIGEKILKSKQNRICKQETIEGRTPIIFQTEYHEETNSKETEINIEITSKTQKVLDEKQPQTKNITAKVAKLPEQEASKGIIRYALSDRSFIDKGWTLLPTEKVVRKMNVYRMRPAHPEFDWFENNKNKRIMQYDSGEKLAEFDDNGRGKWFYKNGRIALDYYDAEEINAQQRFVVYSSGEPDERGRSRPFTILATFDYLGNGIVFDHTGKIRLKYNQTEGVVLDRSIGPVSHWKWHTLNDPPVLQQVMIDTQMPHKDPDILKLGGTQGKARQDNEEMLAIEFDNFIKEKSKKMSQSFKPFQIKMKALKINEQFSLKVLDQATIYLIFRDGSTSLKLNIGMILDHKEIVDTDTAEVGEVSNSVECMPARTDSIAGIQKGIAHAQYVERLRTERDKRLRVPIPNQSNTRLIRTTVGTRIRAMTFNPTRETSAATVSCICRSRKPSCNNVYYDTRLI